MNVFVLKRQLFITSNNVVCAFSLNDLLVKDDVKTSTQSKEFSKSPRLPEDVQWSYTDPQGKVQGS